LLPICSYCKRIRDDQNYWQQVESYITVHSGVQFSHGFCPDCYNKYVKPQLDELDRLGDPPA
jgi:sigma-B regulation protein RsbU (phosphoserine phosphatase)